MNPRGAPLTLVRMTTRNLYRRPVRTGLTALGVAIGVVAIVAFTSIVRGLWQSTDQAIHINNAELIVFQANVAADLLSVLDEERTRAELRALEDVTAAVGVLWHILPVEDRPFFMAYGMAIDEIGARHDNLLRGRSPNADNEILLGSIARRVLSKDVGDTIRLAGEPVEVVGVFSTNVIFFDGAVVAPLPRLQRLAGREGKVTAFQVHLRPGADPAAVGAAIEERYPHLAAVADSSEYGKVDQGLAIANGTVWTISIVAVVIGSIVIANTMWMSVLERTREIGVLRAVGWSKRRIVSVILLEAAGVAILAVVVGSGLGMGLAQLTASLPVSGQFIDPVYDAVPFALALAVGLLLSVLGALLPAWRATRVSPAEALRYE